MVSAGGGLLLSITILDLFPHSIAGSNHSLMPFVLVGFALLFTLEIAGKKGSGLGSNVIGVLLGFIIHAYVEGLSLMASFQLNAKLGISLLIALVLHKIPDGITVASLLLAATKSRMLAVLGSSALGLATLLGVISVELGERWMPSNWSKVVLALTTGVFLYVSASHLVPLILGTKQLRMGIYFFAAMLAYLFVSILLHGNVHCDV
jgi:ZIP family zinc transporter/zinc and cadmium transporter